MKTILTVLGASVLAFALAGTVLLFSPAAGACDKDGKKGHITATTGKTAKKTATATFNVKMKCANCGEHVKQALIEADGILTVEIKVEENRVIVKYDSEKLDAKKIAAIIADKTGYAAKAEA